MNVGAHKFISLSLDGLGRSHFLVREGVSDNGETLRLSVEYGNCTVGLAGSCRSVDTSGDSVTAGVVVIGSSEVDKFGPLTSGRWKNTFTGAILQTEIDRNKLSSLP